jgi:two-component system LytT family response regulator
MKIKAVIVDDELIARDVLRNYLTKYCPQVEILGEAENIKEAVPLIAEKQPQLVFLDVEMPFGNAFDVWKRPKNFPMKRFLSRHFHNILYRLLINRQVIIFKTN